MSDYNPRTLGGVQAGAHDVAAIDEGLRSYMLRVYNYMALGVAFTAIVTLAVMNMPGVLYTIAATPLKWVLFAGIIGLGWFSPRLILTGNTGLAHVAYWSYAAMWGLLIAPMIFAFFQAGSGDLVFRAFLVTAVTFGAMSLYGYTTKRDLSAIASFLFMAVVGLLIAIVVNVLLFQSSIFSLITSGFVVLVFSAVTAYETQAIKNSYHAGDSSQAATGKAIFGAFLLFGSFITIFIHLLSIFGILGGEE